MIRYVLLVVLLVSAAVFAGDTSKPRLTADKQPLPDAAERAITVKLPLLGTKLGGLPEEACPRIWALDSDLEYVSKTRRDMTAAGIDLDDYNYLGEGVAGSIRTALLVDAGRVKKMILYHPGQTDAAIKTTMAKLASDSQNKPVAKGDNEFVFKMKGVSFIERPVGHWEQFVEGDRHMLMGQAVGAQSHTATGPAGIEIAVSDVDWEITNVSKDPEMINAIQKERLVKGMQPAEAFLAMRNHKLYRQSAGKNQVWTWTDVKVEVTDIHIISDAIGTVNSSYYTGKEKRIAVAKFVNGVLDSIEDEETLSKPPK